MYIGALGGSDVGRIRAAFLGLEYGSKYRFETVSKGRTPRVHSEEGRQIDRRLAGYCELRPALEVETELKTRCRSVCARIFNMQRPV